MTLFIKFKDLHISFWKFRDLDDTLSQVEGPTVNFSLTLIIYGHRHTICWAWTGCYEGVGRPKAKGPNVEISASPTRLPRHSDSYLSSQKVCPSHWYSSSHFCRIWLRVFSCTQILPTTKCTRIFPVAQHTRSRGLKGHSISQPPHQMGPCRVIIRLVGPWGPSGGPEG
jgi:hypothetical protein